MQVCTDKCYIQYCLKEQIVETFSPIWIILTKISTFRNEFRKKQNVYIGQGMCKKREREREEIIATSNSDQKKLTNEY